MAKINKLLRKVHEKVHDLPSKPKYSRPQIYTGGVDVQKWRFLSAEEREEALRKPWYVYYSFRNPTTGYMERQDNIKGGANYHKTKEERLEVLETLRKNCQRILEQGFNPYEETDLDQIMSVEEAIEFGLKLKEKTMAANSFKRYRPRIKAFEQFLIENGFSNRFITSVNKKMVMKHLNEVLNKTSPRNRNNTRTDLSSFFQVLEDNDVIEKNFIKGIKNEKAVPVRNKTFSDKQAEDLLDHMRQKSPQLLDFVMFVSYGFLRPIEVCRLRVRDINLKDKTLVVRAKNKPIKQKIIPGILFENLPDLSGYKEADYIFGPNEEPGQWEATDDNRRDNFTKQFAKIKEIFGLGKEYGIYSFRHWAITRLYRSLRKNKTPFEVKSELMLITGHSTMRALEMYLRDLDVELPEDFSDHLK